MRSSNLEMLRILAMIMITFNHITSLGETLNGSFDSNDTISLFLLCGGKFGTNLFVIIGAWFLADKNFKIKRIIKLWLETFVYQIVLYIVGICFLDTELSMLEIIRNISVLLGHYWYPRAYICMLIGGPVIVWIMKKIKKTASGIILAAGGILLSVIPTVTMNGKAIPIFSFSSLGIIFEVIWFCYIFACIYYIKNMMGVITLKKNICWIISTVCYIGMFVIESIVYYYGINNGGWAAEAFSAVRDMHSVPCIVGSFALFMAFKDMNLKKSAVINSLGSKMYSVYLIQTNYSVQKFLWKDIFPFAEWRNNSAIYFCMLSLLGVAIIFSVSVIVGSLYRNCEKIVSEITTKNSKVG